MTVEKLNGQGAHSEVKARLAQAKQKPLNYVAGTAEASSQIKNRLPIILTELIKQLPTILLC